MNHIAWHVVLATYVPLKTSPLVTFSVSNHSSYPTLRRRFEARSQGVPGITLNPNPCLRCSRIHIQSGVSPVNCFGWEATTGWLCDIYPHEKQSIASTKHYPYRCNVNVLVSQPAQPNEEPYQYINPRLGARIPSTLGSSLGRASDSPKLGSRLPVISDDCNFRHCFNVLMSLRLISCKFTCLIHRVSFSKGISVTFLFTHEINILKAVLGWALFPFMYKQYLLHLYQPSNSHYDLLRNAQMHCKISFKHLC